MEAPNFNFGLQESTQRDRVAPKIGVYKRHEGRVTVSYAVCGTCEPRWSMKAKSERDASIKAAAHSVGKHGWRPDGF